MPLYVGDPAPLTFTLTDAAGNPVNAVATQPVLTITLPDQTSATPSVSNPGTGIYTAVYSTVQAGHHLVKWVCADATYPGADADVFDVWSTASTNVLSRADAKGILSIAAANTTYDDLVDKVNGSVTSWLEWYCGAIVPQVHVEELGAGGLAVQLSQPNNAALLAWTQVPSQFSADTTRTVPAPPSPMFPVLVYGVTYPLSQLSCDPVKGIVRQTSGLPFYYGPYLWRYSTGYQVIPQPVRLAGSVVLRHLYGFERGGSAVAVAGADEETTLTPFGFAVPNRAVEILAAFESPAAIA
jgi:hypothetical protein